MKRLGWNPATVLSRGPTLGWFWFRWSEKLIRPSCIRSIGSQLHRTVRITKSKDDITAYFTGHSQTKYWVYTFTAFLIYIHNLNIFSNANAFNIFHQSWIIWGQLEFVSIVVISPPLPPHYFYFYTFWFLQTVQKLSLIQENKIGLLTTKHKKNPAFNVALTFFFGSRLHSCRWLLWSVSAPYFGPCNFSSIYGIFGENLCLFCVRLFRGVSASVASISLTRTHVFTSGRQG